MYASIQYTAAATATQVLADIVTIATGPIGLQLTSLTAPRNGAGSFITSTTAGGWIMHDNVSATVKVLKAPISDDGTKFKYLHLSVYTTGVKFESYRSWNEVAHTGVVNKRLTGGGVDLTISTSVNYVYYNNASTISQMCISCTANHFAAVCGTNSLLNTTGVGFLSEHTRTSPWDTVANGYLPIVYTAQGINQSYWSGTFSGSTAGSGWFLKPLWPATISTDYDVNAAPAGTAADTNLMQPLTMGLGAQYYSGGETVAEVLKGTDSILNSSKIVTPILSELGTCARWFLTYANGGGSISSKSGIYLYTKAGALNDIVTAGGKQHRIWPIPVTTVTAGAPYTGNCRYFAVLAE